jgi:lipid A oxidase
VTANIWRRFKPLGRVTPYAGVGVGLAIPHVDIKPAGLAHTFGYQITGPAVQLVLGASLPINDR